MTLEIAKFSITVFSDSALPSQPVYDNLGPCKEFVGWSHSTYIENSFDHLFGIRLNVVRPDKEVTRIMAKKFREVYAAIGC